jgi:hypothetical protein
MLSINMTIKKLNKMLLNVVLDVEFIIGIFLYHFLLEQITSRVDKLNEQIDTASEPVIINTDFEVHLPP